MQVQIISIYSYLSLNCMYKIIPLHLNKNASSWLDVSQDPSQESPVDIHKV